MMTFSPITTKPVFSGMTTFNATNPITLYAPDYIRRQAIQDFVLTPFADYRVSRSESLISGCNEPACLGLRIHDNIEYAVVPPTNWSHKNAVPEYSSTWKTEFDPTHT